MANAKQLIIESKHGTFTVLYDAEDHDKVSAHTWCAMNYSGGPNKFYIQTSIPQPNGEWRVQKNGTRRRKQKKLLMHRLMVDAPKGMHVDHINGNSLDNRKSNLRICTSAENQRNRRATKNNTSGYKGVGWAKQNKKWTAQIQHNGKKIHIGLYEDKEEAARAYDAKAKELHGEYAYLNFPDE